jgi:hypothetical protein
MIEVAPETTAPALPAIITDRRRLPVWPSRPGRSRRSAHDGDMRRPYDRKFTCSKCGRRGGQQLWFMTADRDEQAFLYPTLGPAP